jgi:serine/threonine-protein kinase
MSPEQIFGEKDIDHRADIWALGVIFYECLSGRRPTQADNIGQILKIITRHELKPLESLVPSLPKDLTDLVNRMLSAERESRPQSLTEVKGLLTRYSDVAVRSFAEPTRISRKSVGPPGAGDSSAGDSSNRVLVRSNSDTAVSALAATDVSSPAVHATPEDLATLSPSSAAAKSEAQLVAKPRARRTGLFVAVGIAAIAGIGFVATRATHKDEPSKPAAPVVSTVATSVPAVVSMAPTASTPPIATEPSATASASAKPAASVRVTIKQHPTAPAVSQASSALPGGVVEKPPF